MAVDVPALVLWLHIGAGVAALAVGPLALITQHRRTRAALAACYQLAVAVLTTSALGLVALSLGRLWWLLPFAIGTEAAVVGGWWLGRDRSRGPTPARARLMGGSYVSLITALVVVSWGGNPLTWVLPTVIGVVAVETAAARSASHGHPAAPIVSATTTEGNP